METEILRKVTTQTVSINTDYDQAFDYISNPLNQQEWAFNFIKEVKPTNDGFLALTPYGEVPLEFHSDKKTGIIDVVLDKGEPIPTRLIKNQSGCEYIFTLFQPKGMPETVWRKEGIPGLKEELETLKLILEK